MANDRIPLLQSRDRDSRFANNLQRPLIVISNGIVENLEELSVDGPSPTAEGVTDDLITLNRVIEHEGDIYWMHYDSVYVQVPGSGWTRGVSPVNVANAAPRGNAIGGDGNRLIKNLGLFQFTANDGQQKLSALTWDTINFRRISFRTKESKFSGDGTWGPEVNATFTPSAVNSSTVNGGYYHYPFQNGSKVYYHYTGNQNLETNYIEFDLENQVGEEIVSADPPTYIAGTGTLGTRQHPTVFCGYSGIVWRFAREGNDANGANNCSFYVERVNKVLPTIDLVLISGLAPDGSNSRDLYYQGRADVFTDPNEGRMFAMHFVRGSGNKSGHVVWKMRYDETTDTLVNEGNVGETVLPPVLRLQDSPSARTGPENVWKAYNLVDASGNHVVICEFTLAATQGNASNFYQWNGSNQEMTFLGQGNDATHSRPLLKIGGGNRISSSRQPYDMTIRVDDNGAPAGTVNLRTRVLGSGQLVDIRWFFSRTKGAMTELAAIQNPSSGTIVGNVLQGVAASSGVEYVVQWRLQDQGVQLTDDFDIHPTAINV